MKAEAPWLIILDRVDEDEGQLLVQTTLPAVWKSYADGEIGALGGVSCGWGWRGAGVANPTERGRDFAGHQTGGVGVVGLLRGQGAGGAAGLGLELVGDSLRALVSDGGVLMSFFGVLVGFDGVVVSFVVVAGFVVGGSGVVGLGGFFVMFCGFLVGFVGHDESPVFPGIPDEGDARPQNVSTA
jgi:hypothetical protein